MASRKFTMQRGWARPATIGFLGATTPSIWSAFVDGFAQRLRALGWIDGANIAIDYRWADGRADRYAKIAADFAERQVDVIVTAGAARALAAKQATSTIPIVFATAGDPVGTKLVKTLARPGRNVTGLSNGQTGLAVKRLDLLRAEVPKLRHLAILGNRRARNIPLEMKRLQRRARALKMEVVTCNIRSAGDIAPAIKRLKGKVDALYVCTDPLITANQVSINTMAVSVGLPTLHAFRDYLDTGGFMSYGPDIRGMFASAADIVDRILRGTAPADIPVKLEKKCELVVNRSTA